MLVSILIPTCNRTGDLERCLRALRALIQTDETVEVIVTDDGSDFRTREMMQKEFPDIMWLEGPKRGPAANRNNAAAKASGVWLVFLDDDCVPNESYLSGYITAFESCSKEMVAVEGPTFRASECSSMLWEAPHNPVGGILISCNFAIRAEDFHQVGRFDERYPIAAFEDTEFAERFRLCGGQVIFAAEASVNHPLRPIPSASKLAARWEGKVIYSLDLGAHPTRVLWALPWHVLRVVMSRFRGKSLTMEHLFALQRFGLEWMCVCIRTPIWVKKWSSLPRSRFWTQAEKENKTHSNFGF